MVQILDNMEIFTYVIKQTSTVGQLEISIILTKMSCMMQRQYKLSNLSQVTRIMKVNAIAKLNNGKSGKYNFIKIDNLPIKLF